MRFYIETPYRMVPYRGVVIHPDWDRPAPRPARPDMEALHARLAAAIWAEIRRMLGLWVSECVAEAILGRDGLLLGLGLGLAGTAEIVVPSRLATLEACIAALSADPGTA